MAFSADRPELFISGQRWDVATGQPIRSGDADFIFEQANGYPVMSADAHRAGFLKHAIQFGTRPKHWRSRRSSPKEEPRRLVSPSRSRESQVRGRAKMVLAIKEMWRRVAADDSSLGHRSRQTRKSFRSSTTPVARLMFSPMARRSPSSARLAWNFGICRPDMLREMYLDDQEELPRVYSMPTVAFSPRQWIAFTHGGEIVLVETLTGRNPDAGNRASSAASRSRFDNVLLSGGRDTTALL